ncbi:DNA phosphorothioation system sulfurtransferase DndC [Desulfocurvibacter africanus]|uniref:Sulfurtransferase DndC n=1 Tax=Desulfocurvibacter africanus subsp. africanus str. Walvis Bay TaxID=690850 RepID=F3YZ99_DESAF|nr:DNA phosphorothioation system sulfurtransferase DndC [Desulfocurvibacter africanus]EGJ50855.1 sulfurtransferase DndC [Desulfocurvibacter africanus subsp. africanus str. Walvis Bay]
MHDSSTTQSAFSELGFKQHISFLHREIQDLYLEDSRPWVVGYSGGKDSTAVLQLIWQAIAELPGEQRNSKKIYVISTDTLVENPLVSRWVHRQLELMNERAVADRMPFEAHQLYPEKKHSFWVNLIGRGYPAPWSKFRWCTERLKIWPSNKFILDTASKYGETILALGTRKAESITRARSMERHEKGRTRARLSRNSQVENCLIYTPIEDWSNDDVWLFIGSTPNPWGLEHRELLSLYQDATEDRECPLITELDEKTPSCGASRFGCWTCTLVARDSSLENMVQNDLANDWLKPLLTFRELLTVKDDKPLRDFRRMRGHVQLFHGQPIHGPFIQSYREKLLRKLLETQKELRSKAPTDLKDIELISLEELREIRRIWLTEKHEIEDRLPKIYAEVEGQAFPETGLQHYHCFGEEELAILQDICGEDRLGYEMIREMLDVEWTLRTKLRRAGLFDNLEQAIRRCYYENSDDAVAFVHEIDAIKRNADGARS